MSNGRCLPGRAGGGQHDYLLELNEAARTRLALAGVEASEIRIVLSDATLYMFATGLVMVVVCVEFRRAVSPAATIPTVLALEALYALGHPPDRGLRLAQVELERRRPLEPLHSGDEVVLDLAQRFGARRWRETDGEATNGPLKRRRLLLSEAPDDDPRSLSTRQALLFERSPDRYSLFELVAGWLSRPGADAQTALSALPSAAHRRFFTLFVGVQDPAAKPDMLPELAYRLSRRFIADYSLAPGDVADSVVRPFQNICHAVATQGAAVLACNTGAQFMEQYVSSAITSAYLPMAIISYHEYLQLIHLTQECALMPNAREPKVDKEHLLGLRASLTVFRLYLRFSHVSDLAHHNRVHSAWRQALDLDRMLDELSADVREGEQVLDRLQREDELARQRAAQARDQAQHLEHERKAEHWRRWGTVGLGAGSALLVLHLLEGLGAILHPWRAWLLQLLKGDKTTWETLASDPRFAGAVHLYHEAHEFEQLSFAVALFAGVVLAFIAYKGGGKFGGGH